MNFSSGFKHIDFHLNRKAVVNYYRAPGRNVTQEIELGGIALIACGNINNGLKDSKGRVFVQ